MARADVAVIGAGLAGLSCAIALAERGARVFLAAKGMAATHWTHGGIDIAAPAGASTAREGVRRLAKEPHPLARLAATLPAGLDEHLARVADAGLSHVGGLDTRFVGVPTPIGTLRPAGTLPLAQAALLESWRGIGLLLIGFRRYRDAWPSLAAANLRARRWPGGPERVEAREVELAELADLRNLNALTVARHFDDPTWRRRALDAIAAAIPPGEWRVGLPAVLGLADHTAAFDEATVAFGAPPFEMVSVPPSVPGLRLYEALRRRLLAAGGRLQWGFGVVGVERAGDRVVAIHTEGAARTLRIAADAFVLASGGIAGGGIRAAPDGTLTERVFGLPVAAPPPEAWFGDDPLAAAPLEGAGIATDDELRPVHGPRNVRVIGSALAGMRYLDERCGDGVAVGSAHLVAATLAAAGASVHREASA